MAKKENNLMFICKIRKKWKKKTYVYDKEENNNDWSNNHVWTKSEKKCFEFVRGPPARTKGVWEKSETRTNFILFLNSLEWL